MKKIIAFIGVSILPFLFALSSGEELPVNKKTSILRQETHPSAPESNLNNATKVSEILRFSTGGHVLGFKPHEVYIASTTHMLKVEFSDSNKVEPVSTNSVISEPGKPTPLRRVTYNNLWDGVTLVYEKERSGIVKSTYYIETLTDEETNPVNRIRLRYNVPVKIDTNGDLVFTFETGEIRESKPVAWQEIDGKKSPVEVSFQLFENKEIGLNVEKYNPGYRLIIDPVLTWHTFMGGASWDHCWSIVLDSNGDVLVTGYSEAPWGSPVNPFAGYRDAFVAKLNTSGTLVWHTFLGGVGWDDGYGIVLDSSGNIYVSGTSQSTWGSPVNIHTGGSADAFVAKLNTSGELQWNTFMGGTFGDYGYGIALDSSGNVYISGSSEISWGSPVNPFASGPWEAFVAKLNDTGTILWHTFLGGTGWDFGQSMALDSSGNVYVTGYSKATWGSPVNSFVGDYDVFVAKLNNSGGLLWNTFMGGAASDIGTGLVLDSSGNVYVNGYCHDTWGSPVNPFAGGDNDAFVAKLNNSGTLLWHTFLGGSDSDEGRGICLDNSCNVYIIGKSSATWGIPVNPLAGNYDAFVAKLNTSGELQWNTFIGGTSRDRGTGITLDSIGNIYVAGYSETTWGSPVDPFAGYIDALVAKLNSGDQIEASIFALDGRGAVLKSTDQGVIWTQVNPELEVSSPKEIVSDNNGDLYILTGKSEIAKSTDGGVTWAIINSDYNGSEVSSLWVTMACSKSNNYMYIIEKSGDDVWRSTDGAESWVKVNDDYNGSVNPRPKGSATDLNGNLFVVDGNADVWKSSDNGETWAKINDDYNGSRNNYADDYIIGDGTHYIIMGVGGASYVYKSTDGGYSFEDMGKVTQYGAAGAMTFAQGSIYAAINYGNKAPDAHRSDDGAASWSLAGEIITVDNIISMTSISYLSIEWINIPAGNFQMGDNFNEGDSDELPVHTVYLSAYKISKYYPPEIIVNNPTGPSSSDFRVIRGGSWPAPAEFMRSAKRTWKNPHAGNYSIGIRLAQD